MQEYLYVGVKGKSKNLQLYDYYFDEDGLREELISLYDGELHALSGG